MLTWIIILIGPKQYPSSVVLHLVPVVAVIFFFLELSSVTVQVFIGVLAKSVYTVVLKRLHKFVNVYTQP